MHISIKMKASLFKETEIPSGVEVSRNGKEVLVKGPLGEIKKSFDFGKLDFEVKEGKVRIGNEKSTRSEKKMMNTITARLKNMIKGVQEKFEYKLKVCAGHFPMTVKVEGNKAIVKNFLGEKKDRIVPIPQGAEVQVNKDIITISAIDIDIAGQAAARFESNVKAPNKDRRIFQDGIYMTNKAGRDL